MARSRRWAFLFFLVATSIWTSQVHRFFAMAPENQARVRNAMTVRQTASPDPSSMRAVNPEWDFMRRTYVVLSLANQALVAAPAEVPAKLTAIDTIIAQTLRDENARGQAHFLLSYAHAKPFIDPDASSIFIDGELLAMMSARELVAPDERWRAESRTRAARIEAAMRRSPTLSAESYPDECWTFCNTTALAALAMFDRIEGTDHHSLARDWVATASIRRPASSSRATRATAARSTAPKDRQFG